MKFRKIVLFIAFIGCSLSATVAQESNESIIKKMAKQIFVDMNNKDYDAILDMMHPKVFELAPKEQLKSLMKATLEGNEEMTLDISKVIPDYKLSKIISNEKDSLTYAFLSYDMSMKMTFNKQTFDDEAKEGMKSMMVFQGMEVDFISDNSMNVIMNDRVTILIKDNSTAQKWSMINYDAGSPMVGMILPSKVIEDAKQYREKLTKEREAKQEKKN